MVKWEVQKLGFFLLSQHQNYGQVKNDMNLGLKLDLTCRCGENISINLQNQARKLYIFFSLTGFLSKLPIALLNIENVQKKSVSIYSLTGLELLNIELA